MSDLAATNCGGGCGCESGGNNCIWLIIILLFCGGGCGGGFGGFGGCGNGCGNNCGNDCGSIIWIILLLCFCGGGNGFC